MEFNQTNLNAGKVVNVTGKTVDDAIELLNEIHCLDPTVLQKMVENRVACNKAVAEHPTVQVNCVPCLNGPDFYEVGLLGILNGLFGVGDDGMGHLAAMYDDDGKIVKFLRTIRGQPETFGRQPETQK